MRFGDQLRDKMKAYGDDSHSLAAALASHDITINSSTIRSWCCHATMPRNVHCVRAIAIIESRYGLDRGELSNLIPNRGLALRGFNLPLLSSEERHLVAFHLPTDYNQRDASEQDDIISWIRNNIVSGVTEYGKFHKKLKAFPYSIRLQALDKLISENPQKFLSTSANSLVTPIDNNAAYSKMLDDEVNDLVEFKTAPFLGIGIVRYTVWSDVTLFMNLKKISLLMGALSRRTNIPFPGLGIKPDRLSLALLVFPKIIDWYVNWRYQRRGVFTRSEVDFISTCSSLTKSHSGWLIQNPQLADNLHEIQGIISKNDVNNARSNWSDLVDRSHQHCKTRLKDVKRVIVKGRDPFQAIMPVLISDKPISTYLKIVKEIERDMPDRVLYPREAAIAVRAIVTIRLAMKLGLRSRNLREMLLCPLHSKGLGSAALSKLRRGELRDRLRMG